MKNFDRHKWTRREFQTRMAALAAAGAGTPSSARKEKEPPARGTKPAGIVKVTSGTT